VHIPCVLVITKNSFLNVSLTNLIHASDIGLAVIESTAQEYEELIREIDTHEADVILLDKACTFADEEALTKLLTLYPKLLMVIVDEESNWLQVYRRENILMTSTQDLLNTLASA